MKKIDIVPKVIKKIMGHETREGQVQEPKGNEHYGPSGRCHRQLRACFAVGSYRDSYHLPGKKRDRRIRRSFHSFIHDRISVQLYADVLADAACV